MVIDDIKIDEPRSGTVAGEQTRDDRPIAEIRTVHDLGRIQRNRYVPHVSGCQLDRCHQGAEKEIKDQPQHPGAGSMQGEKGSITEIPRKVNRAVGGVLVLKQSVSSSRRK